MGELRIPCIVRLPGAPPLDARQFSHLIRIPVTIRVHRDQTRFESVTDPESAADDWSGSRVEYDPYWSFTDAFASKHSAGPAAPDQAASFHLAQIEDLPEREEPNERELIEEPPSDEELRRDQYDPDPSVRSRLFERAKRELAKLDPANPKLGQIATKPGWVPGPEDLQAIRADLSYARWAATQGLTPEPYTALARDPDKDKADAQSPLTEGALEERATVINAWRNGQIKGPVTRETGGADFKDATGKRWDVKSFRSAYPDGFDPVKSPAAIQEELDLGEVVIVNTKHMSGQDLEHLMSEGRKRGWGNRVIYSTSGP